MNHKLRINIFRALSNPTRLQIIEALRHKPLTVSEICSKSGFEQSRVSHGLRYLEKHFFVKGTRSGKSTTYRLNKATILPMVIMADEHLKRHKITNLLKDMHVCDCPPCMQIPERILLEEHVCGCSACKFNIGVIKDGTVQKKYRDDHTCDCAPCSANQKLMIQWQE